MHSRRLAALALAAAASFTFVACGGDDEGDEPPATTADAPGTTGESTDTTVEATDTTEAGASGDECAWLSAEAASEAIGQPMTLGAGGAGGCYFSPESGEGPSIQISYFPISIDVDTYMEQSRALCEGTSLDVPNGDAGFACVSAINPQGVVAFGSDLVVADITDAATEQEGVQLAAEVAARFTAG